MTERGRRAASLDQLRVLRSRFSATESVARGLAYRASPTDVFIATYPKCGMTWLQQILHCLRTGGDSDFDEVTAVVPWLEMADAMSIDPSAPQRAQPRVFKTHLLYERIPKGGRYIHMVRNPADVLVSMFHFHEGWLLEPGAVSLNSTRSSSSFWAGAAVTTGSFRLPGGHIGTITICYIAHEQLLASPAKTIARIVAFAGLALDDELLALTFTLSGIAYMKAHEHQFDDHLFRAVTDPQYVLPADNRSTKVREGKAGAGNTRLSTRVHAALDEQWATEMGVRFGLRNYAALTEQFLREGL